MITALVSSVITIVEIVNPRHRSEPINGFIPDTRTLPFRRLMLNDRKFMLANQRPKEDDRFPISAGNHCNRHMQQAIQGTHQPMHEQLSALVIELRQGTENSARP
jgi:hypothetical protein